MYTIDNYAWMLADPLRREAFLNAMRSAITPDTVVLDLGAGAGMLSLIACRFGARRVYAIDPNPAIKLLDEAAIRNGYADRITSYCADSRGVVLPEQVDVIIADIRGWMPFVGGTLNIIKDACARFLKPGGAMLPAKDNIYLCPVTDDEYYEKRCNWWQSHGLGVDLSNMSSFSSGLPVKSRAGADSLLSSARQWGTVLTSPGVNVESLDHIEFTTRRSGRLDGFLLWFDLEFATGEVLTNHPAAPPLVYGRALLPLSEPIHVEAGFNISVTLKVYHQRDKEFWAWTGKVSDAAEVPVGDFSETDLKKVKIYSRAVPVGLDAL